ncbi:MAG: bifunctional alpha,alpha-trehalose-phosphate synthase (UDP-forming)/trehalose-phosphatase [Dehalococcoidia bacterium]
MGRAVLVSHRLPVTLPAGGASLLQPSAGGLATGLNGYHAAGDSVWIGWPGDLDALSPETRIQVDEHLDARRLVPVVVPAELAARYVAYANRVLWPAFHYFQDRLPIEDPGWAAYEAVNRLFAEAVARVVRPGDTVWVHDYQLLRLPALLRQLAPDLGIGFFLHIPFPSPDVFQVIPQRKLLLQGVLGADLLAFHTAEYQRHFANAVQQTLGIEADTHSLRVGGRAVRLGAFPIGIDADAFDGMARSPEVRAATSARRETAVRTIAGIDRIDYSKGLLHRLHAFRLLLQTHPELHERVRLLQIGVPSREQVPDYPAHRRDIEELVGKINGEFGTWDWTPVHWVARAIPREEIVSVYASADVMAVTPLRDGMNLVAKEFVASRPDLEGTLVLSELAGAAAELPEAIQVNPFDVPALAEAFYLALTMAPEERRNRMRRMRTRVMQNTTERWVHGLSDALTQAVETRAPRPAPVPTMSRIDAVIGEASRAPRLVVFLDYDGTLVPIVNDPALASPPPELPGLIRTLATAPGTEVHIVTGRSPEEIDRWLGALPVSLHAEHGGWTKQGGTWTRYAPFDLMWRTAVLALFREYAETTPGSLVEEKRTALAWHYRNADHWLALSRLDDLRRALIDVLPPSAAILEGDMVLEVRPASVSKGAAADRVLANVEGDPLILAVGDDRTDEDLFAALPQDALTVHVGPMASGARFEVPGDREVRELIRRIAEARRAPVPERVAPSPVDRALRTANPTRTTIHRRPLR